MITTTIATTLLDANKEKFTLNLLKKFRDKINSSYPQIKVTIEGKEIGHASKAIVSKKKLKLDLNINVKGIDKTWEYFFVPYFEDGRFISEKEMTTVNSATIKEVHMVKFPTDVSLKPTVFPFVEGEDYFVVKHDEITDEQIKEFLKSGEYLKSGKPVAVYYHLEKGDEDRIQKDALERGFIIKVEGEFINQSPFYVQAVEDDFETVRKWAENQFKTK